MKSSIRLVYGTVIGTTNLGESGPRSNGNEGVLYSPQSLRTVASPSDVVSRHIQSSLVEGRGFLSFGNLGFKVGATVLQYLELLFFMFFDPKLMLVLTLWAGERFHWSFHLLVVVEASWVQEVRQKLQQLEGSSSIPLSSWTFLF